MAAAKVVVAASSFVAEHNGADLQVPAGARFTSTHPLAMKYPELFRPEGHDIQTPRSK
jgi:hypothetical protein